MDFLRLKRKRFSTIEDVSSFPSDSKTPLEEVSLQEEMRYLEKTSALMSPSLLETYRLYVIEGFSRDEVAQRLGLRLNAVSVRVHRAEKFLRKNIRA